MAHSETTDDLLALHEDSNAAALPPARATSRARRASIAFATVPVVFIALAAYERRWMHDDGFINLRIVRNVLDGFGPVYNLGERVEATTSPLWVALLVALGALGIRLELAAVYAGVALTTLALACAELAGFVRCDRNGMPRAGTWLVPFGAVVYAALPPAWDYASCGLEMGLATFWLATSFLAVIAIARSRVPVAKGDTIANDARESPSVPPAGSSESEPSPSSRRAPARELIGSILIAAWLGLGCLIRPELALYTAAFFVVFLLACDARRSALDVSLGARARRATLLTFAVIALPGAYQNFRMGYYGALTANPAIAKEAFRTNVEQGACYFRNFFGLYLAAIPAVVLLAWGGIEVRGWLRRREPRESAGVVAWLNALVIAAAALHVLYIVVIGGDYMHGRMFLPPVFAALLPLSIAVVRTPSLGKLSCAVRTAGVVVVTAWGVVCALTLRVAKENQCNIGDERGWYTREAKSDHPIFLEEFESSGFYQAGIRLRDAIGATCASALTSKTGSVFDCRRKVELETAQGDELVLAPRDRLVPPWLDTRVGGIGAFGAIGIVGYLLPSTIHLVDRHGLADPIGARFYVGDRGRPGHEKRLTDAWVMARFGLPEFPEDASIVAARRALGCGRVATLLERVRAPLSLRQFIKNLRLASRAQNLRIPPDPFIAEETFCRVPPPRPVIAGGQGGGSFSWRCPEGTELFGIHGSIDDSVGAIAEWVPACRAASAVFAAGDGEPMVFSGPAKGGKREHAFELACGRGSRVAGLFGRSAAFVQQIGLVCTAPGDPSAKGAGRTLSAGFETGTPFDIACPDENLPIGVTGRSGALLDAVGLLCAPR
jgi:arabinofuranosyltransferase